MWRFTVTADQPLVGSFDAEDRIRRVPDSYTVKGMFFSHMVDVLGEDLKSLSPQLRAPPRTGRYLPFMDYPQADYSRIALAVSQKRYPRLSTAEGARRVARGDFAAFAGSQVGSVVLSLVGGPAEALVKMPQLYALVLRGGSANAELTGGGVAMQYKDFHAWVDSYVVGTLEGIVMHYNHVPTIDVTLQSDLNATYDITWR